MALVEARYHRDRGVHRVLMVRASGTGARCVGWVVATCLAAVVLVGCTSAPEGGAVTSAVPTQTSPEPSDQLIQTPSPGSKLAPSLTVYFQRYLKLGVVTGEPNTPLEVEVLTRAIETGKISALDYERAYADMQSCMVQRGIDLPWTKRPDGVYYIPFIPNTLPFTYDQWEAAYNVCWSAMDAIQIPYLVQQDNPDLLANQPEAVVACLRRHGLVDASYTPEQFDHDWAYGRGPGVPSFPFDPLDPVANACMASQYYAYFEAP